MPVASYLTRCGSLLQACHLPQPLLPALLGVLYPSPFPRQLAPVKHLPQVSSSRARSANTNGLGTAPCSPMKGAVYRGAAWQQLLPWQLLDSLAARAGLDTLLTASRVQAAGSIFELRIHTAHLAAPP